MTVQQVAKAAHTSSAISAWADGVRTSTDWRRFLIALLSGAASVLALAPFFCWPVLFVTIPNLVWLTDGVPDDGSKRRQALSAALNGWLFGFGYFSAGLFWIGEAFLAQATDFLWLLPIAVTLIPAGLALFFACAVALAKVFWRPGLARVLVLAIALTCVEWLRGHVLTGFPWNVLGYGFTGPLTLMQVVSLIGVYGLTTWVVILSALPAVVAADSIGQKSGVLAALSGVGMSLSMLAAFWVYGAWRLDAHPMAFRDHAKIRIVQASIPQWDKWIPANKERIFDQHLKLSQQSPSGSNDGLAGISHVVWPEVALPFLPLEIPEAIQRIGAMLPLNTYLLTGALRRDPPPPSSGASKAAGGAAQESLRRRAFNSMLVFNHDGRVETIYDKMHLVPFGEYLPFQETLESIGLRQITGMRGGFTPGEVPRPLLTIGTLNNVAALICYEVIFPGGVTAGDVPDARPDVYINITNDGWFGNTSGPRQHFHQARVRAVETGIPIVRSANNGISAMIGPAGRVESRLELNQRATLDSLVPKVLPKPLYSRFGDWLVLLQIIVLALAATAIHRSWRPI